LHDIHGVCIPVPTPFTDDGASISEIRLARWLRRLGELGAEGFIVGGDAGEFGTLTFAERKQLFDLALRNAPADAVILAHVSTLSTMAGIDLALHASESGAQAAVMMPPYYGRFSDAELAAHFQSVAHHGRLPIYLVDPQAQIGFDLHEKLSQIPGIRIAGAPAVHGFEGRCCYERTHTDEFLAGQIHACPLGALGWGLKGAPLPLHSDALRKLIRDFGTARVLKAAWEFAGIDLGPVRSPARALPAAAQESLKDALREAA
jgi:dihydrodipicolinate synthase/N-acetylneuraminate lyase